MATDPTELAENRQAHAELMRVLTIIQADGPDAGAAALGDVTDPDLVAAIAVGLLGSAVAHIAKLTGRPVEEQLQRMALAGQAG